MQKEIGWLLKEKYFGKPDKNFEKDVARLKVGEPVDYVIGFAEFLGCKINLSKKPLIPRPETEFWVEKAIKDIPIFSRMSECRVLDVFAGSGCIGLAVLKQIHCATVDIADKDEKSIGQIKINCKINKINKKRYKIIKSDIFSSLRGAKRRSNLYDFIFANPPYIPTEKTNRIQKSVLKYEPKQALFGGADGLFYIRKFLRGARKYLKKDGKLFMEFSPEQKPAIEKILKALRHGSGRICGFEFHKDQFDRWRWVSVV